MNIGRLSPTTLPAPVARPADATAVRNAQAAFFAAAAGVPAPQANPVPAAARQAPQPVPAVPAPISRPDAQHPDMAPDRPMRPGTLLDIRI